MTVWAVTLCAASSGWAQSETSPERGLERGLGGGLIRLLHNPQPSFLAAALPDHRDGVYRQGDALGFALQSESDAHLYVLYLQADGRCHLLAPNGRRGRQRVPAGQTLRIPDPQGGYRFRVAAPFGKETLQVIAAVQPIAELDRLASTAGGSAPEVGAELLGALQARLERTPEAWAEHRLTIHSVADGEAAPRREPLRAGVFIGIGKYLHDEIAPPHSELGNSARVIHDLMRKHGKLAEDKARLLLDRQATRAAIEEAISRWLPAATAPGDTVFIYFSGHAGQRDDPAGREPDGQDETLAPFDLNAGRAGQPVAERRAQLLRSQILDDTFARWLQELHGRQVVVILDTCFSGGLVDAPKQGFQVFADEGRRVKDISQLNTVVLTSTGPDEQALFEGTPDNTMWFTHFLAQAIAGGERLTVQEGFEFARDGMRRQFAAQREARVQEPTLTDRALLPIYFVP